MPSMHGIATLKLWRRFKSSKKTKPAITIVSKSAVAEDSKIVQEMTTNKDSSSQVSSRLSESSSLCTNSTNDTHASSHLSSSTSVGNLSQYTRTESSYDSCIQQESVEDEMSTAEATLSYLSMVSTGDGTAVLEDEVTHRSSSKTEQSGSRFGSEDGISSDTPVPTLRQRKRDGIEASDVLLSTTCFTQEEIKLTVKELYELISKSKAKSRDTLPSQVEPDQDKSKNVGYASAPESSNSFKDIWKALVQARSNNSNMNSSNAIGEKKDVDLSMHERAQASSLYLAVRSFLKNKTTSGADPTVPITTHAIASSVTDGKNQDSPQNKIGLDSINPSTTGATSSFADKFLMQIGSVNSKSLVNMIMMSRKRHNESDSCSETIGSSEVGNSSDESFPGYTNAIRTKAIISHDTSVTEQEDLINSVVSEMMTYSEESTIGIEYVISILEEKDEKLCLCDNYSMSINEDRSSENLTVNNNVVQILQSRSTIDEQLELVHSDEPIAQILQSKSTPDEELELVSSDEHFGNQDTVVTVKPSDDKIIPFSTNNEQVAEKKQKRNSVLSNKYYNKLLKWRSAGRSKTNVLFNDL